MQEELLLHLPRRVLSFEGYSGARKLGREENERVEHFGRDFFRIVLIYKPAQHFEHGPAQQLLLQPPLVLVGLQHVDGELVDDLTAVVFPGHGRPPFELWLGRILIILPRLVYPL